MRNRRKNSGIWLMAVGTLLIFGALALWAANLIQEREADAESETALKALKSEIPNEESVQTDSLTLTVTDAHGNEVDWPMDADGAPMDWPLDEDGRPYGEMEDSSGRRIHWPTDENGEAVDWSARSWSVTANGLLPWVTGSDGITAQWPTHSDGRLCTLDELLAGWAVVRAKLNASLVEEQPDYVRNPDIEMPVETIGGNDYIGILEIQELNLSLPIMSEWSDSKLCKAPCRYDGSVYSGDIIIAGHNYSRHFGKLKNLKIGSKARFTDVNGNVFEYRVSGMETLGKYDVDKMRSGEWDMTLFTCTYGGRNRVTIRLERVESAESGGWS